MHHKSAEYLNISFLLHEFIYKNIVKMPVVSVGRDLLFKALGKEYSDEEFGDLCFEFGLELDDVTTQKEMAIKEKGGTGEGDSDEVIYKIEIPANRYDLLCLEGLVRSILIFKGLKLVPEYTTSTPASSELISMTVLPNTAKIRPHVVCAVLRNITFSPASYNSFIDLQDKLHQNICRKRSLVAIGTHDLDTLKPPFVYDARSPHQICFRPLNQQKSFTAEELMDLYSTDSHLKPYLPIIRDSPVYPVILDSTDTVLSLPPIINGEHSKITLDTKNVFIECTATDATKASIVLDILVSAFGEYTNPPFTVEKVKVIKADGSSVLYPELPYRNEVVSAKKLNKSIGINLGAEEYAKLLTRMCLRSRVLSDKESIEVTVPPTRPDVIQECDIMEDAAIAYGYNNVPYVLPSTNCIGQQLTLNKVCDLLKHDIVAAGYTECLTFALCSKEDVAEKLRKPLNTSGAVHISNPKTAEFQVARTTLLPGILKTIACNKNMALPLRLFEVSDVVFKCPEKDVGARNERRLVAVHLSKHSGFEIIHGLLDRVMVLLHKAPYYKIQSAQDETYLPGRCAEVWTTDPSNGEPVACVGKLGVLHPQVLTSFDLNNPASVLDLNLQLLI